MTSDFVRLAARGLQSVPFRLVDVGCSGGIDPSWRVFGPDLAAIAIDASAAECERLAKAERNPAVSYVPAFVSGSAKPLDLENDAAWRAVVATCTRLSYARMLEIRAARLKAASTEEQIRHNAWHLTGLADPEQPVVVPDLLAQRGWTDIDYLKIDIDGADFHVLKSFEGRLAALGVVGVQLEVNFVGGAGLDEHVFHNTDRFMRRHGFDLFRLDVRTYSSGALPARFLTTSPAQTVSGRPVQGEAYYARDVGGGATDMPGEKLLKLAAIAATWQVPDVAAEILVRHRPRLADRIDVDHALDLLAAQVQAGGEQILPYPDYLAAFEKESLAFFPQPDRVIDRPTFWQRVRAARAAFSDWIYADKVELDRARERRRQAGTLAGKSAASSQARLAAE